MRYSEHWRSGNCPTLIGALVYVAASCGICALFGGAALGLSMSGFDMALLLTAPLLGGVLFLSLLVLTARGIPQRPMSDSASDLRPIAVPRDARWVCFLHAVTFGGFAVLASYLTMFFHVQFDMTMPQAVTLTILIAGAECVLRPVGGYLARGLGETQLLLIVFIGAGLLLLDLAGSPPLAWATILPILIMALLAFGNGVVLQIIPQQFPGQAGAVNLFAGASGGVGGWLLLMLFGCIKYLTGGFSLAFVLLAGVAFSGTWALVNSIGKLPSATPGQALERT